MCHNVLQIQKLIQKGYKTYSNNFSFLADLPLSIKSTTN